MHGRYKAEGSSNAVVAATQDSRLYEALALIDALRGGRARERKLAADLLAKALAA